MAEAPTQQRGTLAALAEAVARKHGVVLPERDSTPDGFYATRDYWEDRYEQRTAGLSARDEWYFPEEHIAEFTELTLRAAESRQGEPARAPFVVVSGCGQSRSAETICSRGAHGAVVLGVDFAVSALPLMQSRTMSTCSSRGSVDYAAQSVLRLPLRAGCVSCVFDKGTLDAIATSADAEGASVAYLAEVRRVLCSTGVFVLVTNDRATRRAASIQKLSGGALRTHDVHTVRVGAAQYAVLAFTMSDNTRF